MTFAADRLQTRYIYLAYMVAVRLNSPIVNYKILAADSVAKPPSEENMERGMEAGSGFPVHHGVRLLALLGATREVVRACAQLACFSMRIDSAGTVLVFSQPLRPLPSVAFEAKRPEIVQHAFAAFGNRCDVIHFEPSTLIRGFPA